MSFIKQQRSLATLIGLVVFFFMVAGWAVSPALARDRCEVVNVPRDAVKRAQFATREDVLAFSPLYAAHLKDLGESVSVEFTRATETQANEVLDRQALGESFYVIVLPPEYATDSMDTPCLDAPGDAWMDTLIWDIPVGDDW